MVAAPTLNVSPHAREDLEIKELVLAHLQSHRSELKLNLDRLIRVKEPLRGYQEC